MRIIAAGFQPSFDIVITQHGRCQAKISNG